MTVNIHGKEYVTVAERLEKAGKDLIEVNTEVLFTDPVVIKATIKTNKGTFTGISAANDSKSIEKESPYEVAETSAVGRALAFAGYETTNGIASAEEMYKANVISPKTETKTVSDNKGLEVSCSVCKSLMVNKTGTNKDGKKWSGWFCPQNKDHPPRWV
jgi:hypothetical protein